MLTVPKASAGTELGVQQILYHVLFIQKCIIYLDEPAPVTINQENDIIEQKQGSSFSAKCFTDNLGYPEGTLNWFKDNSTCNITTDVVKREKFFVGLYFKNLKVEDMGTYRCQITNDLGRQVKIFQLVVSGMSFSFLFIYIYILF